jgi:hypothetical protein
MSYETEGVDHMYRVSDRKGLFQFVIILTGLLFH